MEKFHHYNRNRSLYCFYYVQQDDLVMLPKNLAQNLSNISRLVLIKRIGAGLHVVDPYTAEVSGAIIS